MEDILRAIEKATPKKIYKFFQPAYHYLLSLTGSYLYLHPSKKLYVVGVTGTKGKSSTVEFVNAVLTAGGKKTAVLSTIHFKIGEVDTPNKYKMTMPGRFFTQKFLSDAKHAGCTHAVIEMTSEGARFYRHKNVHLDTLIFTNLKPEHIESHGSFEKYKEAKLRLVHQLARSKKLNRLSIANADDEHGFSFLIHDVEKNIGYSLRDIEIISQTEEKSVIKWEGLEITIPIPGKFNISNALAALTLAKELGIKPEDAKKGIESLSKIRGRVEKIRAGQDFDVVVDYAHTDDSLRKLYETFPNQRKIAVLGSTGGGRDSWKRSVLGKIADELCDEIIVTNEDPYDEDPLKIMWDVAKGVTKHTALVVPDRREAIAKALSLAKKGDVVLISGKGTDPYIMGANGTKIEWDDARVAEEEIKKLVDSHSN